MKEIKILLALSIFLVLISGCKNTPKDQSNSCDPQKPLSFTAETAPEWTALMERTSGWFGADGIFSIPLDGKEEQGVLWQRDIC